MKKVLFLFILTISFLSCKKENGLVGTMWVHESEASNSEALNSLGTEYVIFTSVTECCKIYSSAGLGVFRYDYHYTLNGDSILLSLPPGKNYNVSGFYILDNNNLEYRSWNADGIVDLVTKCRRLESN
ncbi:hypothetical protein [Bacteroides sp. 51]|uniref:hypothetical protein n=1 Tax=Bacteroides sp. 51 TaxID=2302938 RepID=UPI0013D711CB|nr:hypothetical protein [Bacteroides sp. 51]NDV84859.1 hypothetical protein [Bacteroides sp. 51]